ncbi:MAG: hypothetical protein M5R38_17190 [Candidatus Methylomirabilis sp.]|nr:hypothetical protein [Candidatus Methylomirabilis sp.]
MGFDRLDTITDLFGAGLAYSQPTWSANLNGSYSIQDNHNGISPPDTTTWNATTGLSYRPTQRLNLAPSFGFTRSRDRVADVTISTYLPTLTANVALIPDLLTFDTQASFTRTVADDDSTRTNSFTGIFRLSLSLEQFLLNYGKQTVSLRFDYNRFDDQINALNSQEQWGVFVIIDLLAPLPLLPPVWGDLFGPKSVGRLPDVQTAFGFRPGGY